MNKPDYTDINRFLVSIGIILYAFAFLIPWFFLKDYSFLEITNETISNISEKSNLLIEKRQNFFLFIYNAIPKISFAFILLGTFSVIVGLFRWFKRQKILDQIDDLRLDQLRLNVESLSKEEVKEKAKKEINLDSNIVKAEEAEELEEKIKVDEQKFSTEVKQLVNIESLVLQKIKLFQTVDYSVKSNVILTNGGMSDILLQSFIKNKRDKVVEIKYIQKKTNFNLIKNALTQINHFRISYSQRYRKPTIGYVIVVYKDGLYSENEITQFKATVSEYCKDHKIINIRVLFYSDKNIDKADFNFLYN